MLNNNMSQHMPGMPCPKCEKFIPISIVDLLFTMSIRCPHCFLRLDIDRQNSQKAMQILAKVNEAQQRVEKTSQSFR